MTRIWPIAAGVAAAGLAAFLVLSERGEAGLLRPDDEATVALGRTVYEANCASCHGGDLEGEPNWRSPKDDGRMPAPPHDETGHTWHHPDVVLFELTKYGPGFAVEGYRSAMPAYDEILEDREILAALSYIKSRWPDEIRTRHDAMNAGAGGG